MIFRIDERVEFANRLIKPKSMLLSAYISKTAAENYTPCVAALGFNDLMALCPALADPLQRLKNEIFIHWHWYGLAARSSFIGPFETADLNDAGGVCDFDGAMVNSFAISIQKAGRFCWTVH